MQNRWTTRRLTRVYDILSCYPTPLGSHIWEISRSRFLGFVGSLSSSEQQLWFPNQNVQDPVTWTLPHLIQLQHEYKTLLQNYNCDIQEFITVQDPPAPPSNILHLSPLTSLHSDTTRNMELPLSGEPCKVQRLSQRTLSRQLMRSWTLWNTNIDNASNARISTWMLEQLVSHTENFPHDK